MIIEELYLCSRYYPWQVAAPMIMSAVAYLRPLPDATQSKLQKKYMPKKVRHSLVTSSVASLQRVKCGSVAFLVEF